jgi:hypothetical protein
MHLLNKIITKSVIGLGQALGFVIPSRKFSERGSLHGIDEKTQNARCSFRCNCLILGEVARPERFELPAFWFFVVEKSGNPKALPVSHLQAAPPSKLLPQLVHNLVNTRAQFMTRGAQTGDETLSGPQVGSTTAAAG